MTALDPVLDNVSITRRPDAISLDYHTCFSLGPRAVGDSSAGAIDRPWRIRYDANTLGFYATGATDTGTTWGTEALVFTHVGEAFEEIDAAFDQQGRIVVAGARGGHVWIYYYNPLLSAYAFEDFGIGRTPRVVLDNPFDTAISDVLVFYLSSVTDSLMYRQQRDRYQVAYNTGLSGVANMYLEDAARTTDYRIAVLYSIHDPVLGRYTSGRLESALYPVHILMDEGVRNDYEFATGNALRTTLIVFNSDGIYAGAYPQISGDWLDGEGQVVNGDLHDLLIYHSVYEAEALKGVTSAPLATSLLVDIGAIYYHTLYDVDAIKGNYSIRATSTLTTIVFFHTVWEAEAVKSSATIQSTSTLV